MAEDDDLGYVEDVLELLWPGHRRVGGPSMHGLVMVPPGRPRLVLPRWPARVAASALRNYNTAAAGVGEHKLAVGALALRCGAGVIAPGGLRTDADGIEAELSERLGREVFVSLYLGPPRAVQKPVLQVLDPHGTTIAFAKVSVSEHTAELIAREADILRALDGAGLMHLRAPALLHDDSWHGRRLTVQEALSGDRRQVVTPSLRASAGRELFDVWGSTRREIADSGFAARMLVRAAKLPDGPIGTRLRLAVDAAADRTADIALRFGTAHGDWSAWNMTAAGSQLKVWDWEGCTTDVPLGFDELHWVLNHAVAIGGEAPERAVPGQLLAAPAILAGLGVGEPAASATALWYVLDLATRYAADGEDVLGGTPMSRLDDWVPPTLVALFHELPRGSWR